MLTTLPQANKIAAENSGKSIVDMLVMALPDVFTSPELLNHAEKLDWFALLGEPPASHVAAMAGLDIEEVSPALLEEIRDTVALAAEYAFRDYASKVEEEEKAQCNRECSHHDY